MCAKTVLGFCCLCLLLVLVGCDGRNSNSEDARNVSPPVPPPALPVPPAAQLIARQAYFASPVQYQGRISPDGAKVSWLALTDGALNLFVADADGQSKPMQYTFGSDGVDTHRWTPNSAYILYVRALAATNTKRVYALNVQTGNIRNLVPVEEGDNVALQAVSKNWPNSALVRIKRAGQHFYDLYRVNLESGEKTKIANNPGYEKWIVDSEFAPRLGIKRDQYDGEEWVVIKDQSRTATLFKLTPSEAMRTYALGIDASSTNLYYIDGRIGDKQAGEKQASEKQASEKQAGDQQQSAFSSFVRVDLQSGAKEVLATGNNGNIIEALFHPITGEPLAYFENGLVPRWRALSAGIQPILDRLEAGLGPRFFILAATNTSEQLVVYSDRPNHPGQYSVYDLQSNKMTTFFETMPELANGPLSSSEAMTIKARDGFSLAVYFTPAQSENPSHAPLVVIPQPGIKSRMYYGFDSRIQWLSNRGYNVLEVNTRGATGLGQVYAQAGIGAGILQAKNDLIDAVQYILDKNLADKSRIGGFAWYAGGRSLLDMAGVEDTPLRCAIVMDPIINVEDALNRANEKQKSTFLRWLGAGADRHKTDLLKAISPGQNRAVKTKTPVLVLQSNAYNQLDPEISLEYVKNVRANGGNAIWIHFPEVTNEPTKGPSFIPLAALSEAYFANCLGGNAEPIADALNASTYQLNAGPEGTPGLNLQ